MTVTSMLRVRIHSSSSNPSTPGMRTSVKNDVETGTLEMGLRRVAAVGLGDVVSALPERNRQHLAHVRVVFDQ